MAFDIRVSLLAAAMAAAGIPGAASTAELPIGQGVWVPAATACDTATNVFPYGGGRFGSLYFYGPNQAMGPADETEVVSRVSPAQDGYWMVNEGPLEVRAGAGGQANVRAFSPVQGETWNETVRLCPLQDLPAKTRQAVARLGLSPKP